MFLRCLADYKNNFKALYKLYSKSNTALKNNLAILFYARY